MLVIGAVLSLLVGISLGLLGGGGSILTVPILRYVLGMDAHEAIAVSMIVVCVTSVAALVPHVLAGRVNVRIGLAFGMTGTVGAFSAGRLTHLIPGAWLLTGFAALMLVTALAMLRTSSSARSAGAGKPSLTKAAFEGLLVGAVTGLFGAGGGFAIVPALVIMMKLPMDVAIGTSLLVIALNTAAGFLGVVGEVELHLQTLAAIAGAAVLGSVIGAALSGKLSPRRLRAAFGYLVLAMAVLVLTRELPGLLAPHADSVAGAVTQRDLARAVAARA
ncbi:MAG TPA: sulfite exporter TauE/SafE family protein [Polyangiales bacterium]|jgi:uncharacterized membrane protein YfcA|nr:sulfite exporter TauE/SafE family protein [Polyangiales bacterium]